MTEREREWLRSHGFDPDQIERAEREAIRSAALHWSSSVPSYVRRSDTVIRHTTLTTGSATDDG